MILNVMTIGKLLWAVVVGDGTGWAMTVPALTGLLIGNAVLIYVVRRQRARTGIGGGGPANAPERFHRVSAGRG